MRAPIDLSEVPPSGPPPRPRPPVHKKKRGTGSALDEPARRVFFAALVLFLLALAYLLAGLWSGAWSHHAMAVQPVDWRLRQISNISTAYLVLQIIGLVGVLALLVCCLRSEGIGYALLLVGAVFYLGLPLLTGTIYQARGFTGSSATQLLLHEFQDLAWLFGIPGLLWAGADLARRFGSAAEKAAIQRANLKYGANVARQPVAKQKQKFLGRCWEGPFCRDHIREKCPIFLRKRGPCWWYKEGCMCEERIVLQAIITPNWKDQAARAAQSPGARTSHLTPWAKRERCRNCIIYNEHERQKYKGLVGLALVVVPVLLLLNHVWLQSLVGQGLAIMDTLSKRLSFSENSSGLAPVMNNSLFPILEWVIIGALGMIIVTQVLKFIEVCCFKWKI